MQVCLINQFLNYIYRILDKLPPLPALPDTPPKTYVDPLIYVDVLDAVQEFTNEINPVLVSLQHLIGAGIYICFIKLIILGIY